MSENLAHKNFDRTAEKEFINAGIYSTICFAVGAAGAGGFAGTVSGIPAPGRGSGRGKHEATALF